LATPSTPTNSNTEKDDLVSKCPHCDSPLARHGWPGVYDIDGKEEVFIPCKCEEATKIRLQEKALRDEERRHWKLEAQRTELETSAGGRRFSGVEFSNWDMASNPEALDMARSFANKHTAESDRGLLLYGPPGTGKTRLLLCVLREVINPHNPEGVYSASGTVWPKDVFWTTVVDLLARLRRSYSDSPGPDEADILDELRFSRLLALDDLGAEKWSEWAESRIYELLDYRYRNGKPVFITTNLPLKEFGEQVGPRIMDRLIETCDVIALKGKSYRQKLARDRRARVDTNDGTA
jgi:DNA replication protein DnaC